MDREAVVDILRTPLRTPNFTILAPTVALVIIVSDDHFVQIVECLMDA